MNLRRIHSVFLLVLVVQGFGGGLHAQQANLTSPGSFLFLNDHVRPTHASLFIEESFLRDSTYTYERGSYNDGEPWILKRRSTFQYGAMGLLAKRNSASFEKELWTNTSQIAYTYNQSNELVQSIRSDWDSTSQQWFAAFRHHIYYDYAGNEIEKVDEKAVNSQWIPQARTVQEYNDYGLVGSLVMHLWSNASLSWLPRQRRMFTYSEDLLLSEELIQTWLTESQAWVNDRLRNFYYDEHNKLVESLFSSWSGEAQEFVAEAVTYWDYNENGQPEGSEVVPLNGKSPSDFTTQSVLYNEDGTLDNVVTQKWNEESNTWEPFSYEVHFWSLYLKGKPGNAAEISCTFANPYTLGLPWHCEALKKEVLYTARLYDLIGRQFASVQFEGGHTFRFGNGIPSGIYIAVISGGLDVHTEKVIIR